MSHTPGPWKICESDPLTVEPNTYGSHDEPICHALGKPVHRETAEAAENARLIAAAPELLEACRLLMKAEAMQQGERGGAIMGQISTAIDAARAALEKIPA